ncbi:glutamine--fructose-6-phosphate transaminase (isomerizing) [Candidatus Sumerlaeota bacterium]|nr:glutamine--fructose-6-phosphate transaminase (isomerizing) [Candidatus Sumerlaeota bacterium]MBI3735165.1 glutamine--fructose-6-phosphate transaminase (isomerizing) [Candidatus Sumerlaeota bacterium]
MCGIVGCVGVPDTWNVLIQGLNLLEYRGYDSAGMAIVDRAGLHIAKAVGRVRELEQKGQTLPRHGWTGIAHTRWATHGGVTVANAHPHLDTSEQFAVVHNGVIENYQTLRTALESEGIEFRSQTDTEIVAHLVAKFYDGDLAEAVRMAARELQGTYGLVVVSSKEPQTLVGARMGSPLVLGLGEGAYVLASDTPPLLSHTAQVVYLNDGEIVRATPDGYTISSLDRAPITPQIEELDQKLESIELGRFEHYMLKEIFDQPSAIINTTRGRIRSDSDDVVLGGARLTPDEIQNLRRIIIVGCGTSWHAGLIGKYIMEDLLRIPVEVEYASELRYRNPIVRPGEDLAIFISQSGETADTLAALREMKRKGARTLGICNVVNSTIAREVHSGIYTHAGIEIGVASTKAFTTQVVTLLLLALHIGRGRDLAGYVLHDIVKNILRVPEMIQSMLTDASLEAMRRIAQSVVDRQVRNFLYLGRGVNFPVALEGALKMKEISYIHAEGYPAAEMKHGPIALIDEEMPVVVIAPKDRGYDKIKTNIQELLARKARIIGVTTEGNLELEKMVEQVFYVPAVIEPVLPLLTVVPLQLLAYYTACFKGLSVDKPRNLAKSVTVE